MKRNLTIALFFLHLQILVAQRADSISVQQAPLTKLQNDLTVASWYAQEKFYIITDRSWYFPGDDVWFKVHITTSGLPITNSGVLYVDIADSTGKILIKKILPFDDIGVSYGMVKLPLDLKKGWYSLGVQTQWNRNFNDGYVKLIYLAGKEGLPEEISFFDPVNSNEKRIQFFPEGGNFVSGLQNHFAVRSLDKNGQPVSVKGSIIDLASKDTLSFFETSSKGMGEFTLPSITHSSIIAIINWPEGITTNHHLPDIQPQGMTLHASVSGERLFYKIESTPLFLSQTGEFILAIIMHGEIAYSKIFNNANELISYTGHIPLHLFPEGIFSLRLYTTQGEVLAERLIYHHKDRKIFIEKNEISFEPKARNEISIAFPDTLYGTYSVSITDADLSKELNQNEKPYSYLREFDGGPKDMNLFLLTTTHDFLPDTLHPIRFTFQQGLNFSGNVSYQKGDKPVSGKFINFFPKNSLSGNFLLTDSLDENGDFELQDLFLQDSSVIYWKINELNKKELNKTKLTINQNWFDSIIARPTLLKMYTTKTVKEPNQPSVQNTLTKYLAIDSIGNKNSKVLPEVTVYAKQRARLEELDKKYAGTSLFGGRLGSILAYDLEEEKGHYSNIFTFLQSRIPGLKITGPITKPLLLYRSAGDPLTGEQITNVALFLNETRIYEATDFAAIPINEIGYVKIFKPPFSYILVSEAPSKLMNIPPKISLVIAIYLKKEASKITLNNFGPQSFQSLTVHGFSLQILFPLPEYSDSKILETILDKRLTLYWNPELEIINGKANFVFYNNDFSKRFLIKIEGVNEMGEIVSFKQIIE